MKKEELTQRIQAIGTCTDDAQRRTLLADLQADCEKDYDERETFRTANENLTKDNENLRSANMKLFLRLGKEKEDVENNPTPTNQKEQPTKRDFSCLFNEKGELK